MTDIVERLRKYPKPERCNNIFRKTSENAHEAAAEIERLRAALREILEQSSLVFEQTRGRLFLIHKISAVALGADPQDFEPGGKKTRAALAPPAGETNE